MQLAIHTIVATTALFASCKCLYLFTGKVPRELILPEVSPTKTQQPHRETTIAKNTISPNSASNHLRFRSGILDSTKGIILTVNTREINVSNITAQDLKYLNDITELEFSSRDEEKEKDVLWNSSKFTRTFDLNLNFLDLGKTIGIEDKLIKPYKLNFYTEGCCFADHGDVPRHRLVGTLILILPTKHEGGEITFDDINLEDSMSKDNLKFIYFDKGLKHTIRKVISGSRITLVYHVLDCSSKTLIKADVHFNDLHEIRYKDLLEEACNFCRSKKNILFGQSKYRNDVFYRLVDDLKKYFEVRSVVVAKDAPTDVSKIVEVYEVEDLSDKEIPNPKLMKHVTATYKVEHILFPLASNLNTVTSLTFTGPIYRYYGNAAINNEDYKYNIEYYSAFLINAR